MSKPVKILIAVVLVAVVAAAAGLVWWFQRDDAPEAVSLESAVAQVEAAGEAGAQDASTGSADGSVGADSDSELDSPSAAAPGDSTDDQSDPEAAAGTGEEQSTSTDAGEGQGTDADGTAGGGGESQSVDPETDAGEPGIDGVWTVQVAEGEVDLLNEPAVSFAGFRVDEVLAGGIGDFTAVGRTADIAGSIEISGTTLVAAQMRVDFTTLRTDNSSRDRQVQRALDTASFPEASFRLTEPVNVGDLTGFSGSATGEMTIKGVTNVATFDLEAELLDNGVLVVVGSAPVVFADYGVTVPSAPIVVSAEDHGIMELQLLLTR